MSMNTIQNIPILVVMKSCDDCNGRYETENDFKRKGTTSKGTSSFLKTANWSAERVILNELRMERIPFQEVRKQHCPLPAIHGAILQTREYSFPRGRLPPIWTPLATKMERSALSDIFVIFPV